MSNQVLDTAVQIAADGVRLEGNLKLPARARGLVVFAHGSGSGRHSPRNRFVAGTLGEAALATLLLDLLTPEEDAVYQTRFDIDLLTRRLLSAAQWAREQERMGTLGLGFFGASTGAAAALKAAAELGGKVQAVVSRGGRPDLALDVLERVTAPTRLIVGGRDELVLELNRQAYARLQSESELVVIPEATHLFEEPGALEEVARLAAEWFARYLDRSSPG
jgi:putative phosphoribosyl transferase